MESFLSKRILTLRKKHQKQTPKSLGVNSYALQGVNPNWVFTLGVFLGVFSGLFLGVLLGVVMYRSSVTNAQW